MQADCWCDSTPVGSFYRGSEDNGGLALQAVQQCQQEQWLLHSSTDHLVLTQLFGQLVPAHINSFVLLHHMWNSRRDFACYIQCKPCLELNQSRGIDIEAHILTTAATCL